MIKHVRNTKNKILRNLLVICVFLLLSTAVEGATLYLEPAKGQYQQGDVFIIKIKIDIEKECINTVETELKFSPEVLKAIDFSKGSSIITLWLKSPEINQESGLISFSGGIPGGYCGEIPGDPGPSHLLGKLVFRIQETDVKQTEVVFGDDSQVLLNDGFGTPAKLSTKGSIFTILPEKEEPSKDEWREEIEKDSIPPEPFEIEISQDPSIFEGKYFIVFSTTDKQTGLDYYEVREGKRAWKTAESPYLLEDQGLRSTIKVRAVDKAGNERIAEYIPPKKPLPYWIIILILAGIGVIWLIIKKCFYAKAREKYQK